jgi:uncharacterized membrane protein
VIASAWTYIALLLICAGLFPFLEKRAGWRIFTVLPPIVLTYLLVTGLSVVGVWDMGEELKQTQKTVLAWVLPSLMFLLLVNCDLKAIIRLGPRILAGFCCAVLSIYIAIAVVFLAMHKALPGDAWQTWGSVAGGWIGGTANLVAVSQAVEASPGALSNALLVDSLCYSVWVLVLFSSVPLQKTLNGRLKADAMADTLALNTPTETKANDTLDTGLCLLWLGFALLMGRASAWLAGMMPASEMLSTGSWTLLIATVLGLLASFTPLRKITGSMTLSSALLAIVVATIASQGSFSGLNSAPLFIIGGFLVLLLHGLMMLLCARLLRFDLALCGISSLSCVGGVASTPLLAAAYSPVLAPVGVLLAMLGYLLGTGGGIAMAGLLKQLGA